MVTVTVKRQYLQHLLGKKVSDEALVEALAQIKAGVDSETADEYSLEVTGDRPDLLSAEGVARALKGYLGIEKGIPAVSFKSPGIKIFAEESATKIRRFVVGAVVRNVKLSADDVADLFQVQEKLDLTHGRRRKKVSIGLYDLRSLRPPFYFRALDAEKTSFVPLKSDRKMALRQILQDHPTGIEYSHLLRGHSSLPCLVDSAGEVLSLVPIINGVSSAVTEKSTELFIDHTGTDLSALNTSLNILCHDFADRGAAVETVEVHYGKKKVVTPHSSLARMDLDVAYANRLLGTRLSAEKMAACLAKQRISAQPAKKGSALECEIPAYRADFLHPADLVEEVALGFGFNNFEPKPPSVFTKGKLSAQTYLQDSVEDVFIGAGFLQVANHVTTNKTVAAKAFFEDKMIEIKNPVSEEYSHLRSHLLPGVLDLLSRNTHAPYPQKVFEVGEAVEPDAASDTKTATKLKACMASAHASAGLSEAASILSALMTTLKLKYYLRPLDSKRFIDGRGAKIILHRDGGDVDVGFIGELHPSVLENFGLEMPCAVFEVALDRSL